MIRPCLRTYTNFHSQDAGLETLRIPHTTFMESSILYARNNNLCIYYEGMYRMTGKKIGGQGLIMRVNGYGNIADYDG